MKTRSLQVGLLAVLLISAVAFTFGGWAVITVDDLPDYVVAGTPVDLSFTVRQHGVHLLDGLSPRVTLKSGDMQTTATARPALRGRYVASVTAPAAGYWTPTILSGFMGGNENTLLPIRAIAAGAQPPRPLADADRGHRLFFAKGCVTCHVRGSEGRGKVGPELTGKRYVADYVAKFLNDPESSPLSRATSTQNRMPKLGLKKREIASLVAFLNSEGQVSKAP